MRNKKFTILSVAIMIFIFSQSALPSDLSSAESGVIVDLIMKVVEDVLPAGRQAIVFAVRKGAHFTEYLILGCALMAAAGEWMDLEAAFDPVTGGERMTAAGVLRRNGIIAWLIGTAYSVTDEFHQIFVPGRSCELRDVVIDGCGVLAGVALVAFVQYWKRSGSRSEL